MPKWPSISSKPKVNCLHCIVFDRDRVAAFEAIRRCLRHTGFFIVETMTAHPDVDFSARNPRCRLDFDGVLWSLATFQDLTSPDVVTIDNTTYFPRRRVVTAEHFKVELHAAGFAIIEEELLAQGDCDPNQLRLVCRPT